jgi:hypothetical protein
MQTVPFNATNPLVVGSIVLRGEYEKIKKKSEGGIYSDVLVDLIHLMMDFVYLLLL